MKKNLITVVAVFIKSRLVRLFVNNTQSIIHNLDTHTYASYFRPTEVDLLIGDPSKAKQKLGWVPEYDLASLVKDMMASDLELFKNKNED